MMRREMITINFEGQYNQLTAEEQENVMHTQK